MNEKFYSLSEEKQQSILNAAMEVFALNEYKRASTDLIAAKAGVSKGLLFYYFHNKKELFLYLYDYVIEIMRREVVSQKFREITDFFELLEYSAAEKVKILAKNPYIMEFAMRVFYSEKEEVSEDLQQVTTSQTRNLYQEYFQHLDTYKFREGIDQVYIFKMLVWMADGYMHDMKMNRRKLELYELQKEFHTWIRMLKRLVYREEYLDEDD
ncbi:MAG: TetR/AcrR family transcriptional regulator [Lachnospiraceae bacterium]|nr:TetR/AcrR family transcriptional regulator [Lachnospiraceae bacterium]